MPRKIVVCGRAVWDDWQDAQGGGPNINFGGPGANVAVHLARLGFEVSLATWFGTDSYSHIYKSYLKKMGVDISYATTTCGSLPTVRMWLGQPDVFCPSENDAFDELEQIDLSGAIAVADAVVFADFPLRPLQLNLLEKAVYLSPHISLTTGRTPAGDLARLNWQGLFLNRKEADFLGGNERIRELSNVFVGICFVTQGKGATIAFKRGHCEWFPVPPAPCLNPIGGGDAFAAGVIAGLERGEYVNVAVDLGHAAASVIIREIGCHSDTMTWDYLKTLAGRQ